MGHEFGDDKQGVVACADTQQLHQVLMAHLSERGAEGQDMTVSLCITSRENAQRREGF